MIITVCRKRLGGSVNDCVVNHQCGGINIEASRIGDGRFPSNLILSNKTANVLDKQSGDTKGTIRKPTGKSIYPTEGSPVVWNSNDVRDTTVRGYCDEGGASRYFKNITLHNIEI